MDIFGNLFDDLMGWLTIGIVTFMLVMMGYLFTMFVRNMKDHK